MKNDTINKYCGTACVVIQLVLTAVNLVFAFYCFILFALGALAATNKINAPGYMYVLTMILYNFGVLYFNMQYADIVYICNGLLVICAGIFFFRK